MNDNKINWKTVRKEAKKSGMFKGHFDPCTVPFEQQCWNVCLSVRATGKTTGYVLLGMLLYKLYGVRLEYCRLMPDDIRPKDHCHFFDSIIEYGYIDWLTDGKYNSCVYKAGFWYYRKIDKDGNVESVSEDPFMHTFAVRKAMDMKSNYTSNAVFIIFDEFIDPTKLYRDDFVLLCDCISTIFRNRVGWVNLLANTIDRQSVWFKELCIAREVATMQQGESKRIEKDGLTPVRVSILGAKITEAKAKHNLALFNFANRKLEAITGTADGWAMRVYPRIPKAKQEILIPNLYFDADGFMVRAQLIDNEQVGLCLQIVDTPKTYDDMEEDAIIYTNGVPRDKRDRYMFTDGTKLSKVIRYLNQNNKIYYSSNEAGITFDSFMQYA